MPRELWWDRRILQVKPLPYARRDALGTMASLIDANALLDSERTEFRTLFGTARTLLSP